jgi:DNA-binding LacI/PurR family transcriptional regulator
MPKLRILSATEQVAAHLCERIGKGELSVEMPGALALATELGVNHKTVEGALATMEKEGILIARGSRRARGIVGVPKVSGRRPLRIAIVRYEPSDARVDYMLEIRHELSEAGHSPFYTDKCCVDFENTSQEISRFVDSVRADAWLLQSASRGILEWFAADTRPTCALFGRHTDLDLAAAATSTATAYQEAVRELIAQGHRRIVLLARPMRKVPEPGIAERAFLDTLNECGIAVGDYHFPLWENNKDGFYRGLASLFMLTPPTALIIQEAALFAAAQQFLASRGLRVPKDVSLVCTDPDPTFAWRQPSIAHFQMDSAAWVAHVVRWAANVSQGKDYRRKITTKVQFITGGTIGPAPEKGR